MALDVTVECTRDALCNHKVLCETDLKDLIYLFVERNANNRSTKYGQDILISLKLIGKHR